MSPKPSLPALLLRTQSDARLTALARDGHERAFEAIVERYRKPLQNRVRRMLSPERAEDVVQQTFLSTWTAIQKGTEIRDLRAWLYRVAVNHGLNAINSSGYDYDELKESLQGGTPPAEDAERRLVIRETLAGIAGLPERQREALLQIAVGGRTHAEVAAEFGMTDTAVRQLVHRARKTLRAAATAVIPAPLLNWALALAARGGGEPTQRIAEAAAGGGGAAGITAVLVKGSAVVAVVAAVATPAVIEKQRHDHSGDNIADAAESSVSGGSGPNLQTAALPPGLERVAQRGAGHGKALGRGRGLQGAKRVAGRGGERGRGNGGRLGAKGFGHDGPGEHPQGGDHGDRGPSGSGDGDRRTGDHGGDGGRTTGGGDHSGGSGEVSGDSGSGTSGSGTSGSGTSGSGTSGSGTSGGDSGTSSGSGETGTSSTDGGGDSHDGLELHSSDAPVSD
jgi:RNA polymerase sigma factor (sigma-70 family)